MSKTRFKPIKKSFQMSGDRSKDVTLTLTHRRNRFIVFSKIAGREIMSCNRGFLTQEAAQKRFDEESDWLSVKAAEAGFQVEYERKKTGRKIPCNGEAHSNPFIDHCMVCLGGTWGELDELAPIDFERAKRARLDIPMPGLSDEEFHMMQRKVASGEATSASTHRGNSFYSVYRWTGK